MKSIFRKTFLLIVALFSCFATSFAQESSDEQSLAMGVLSSMVDYYKIGIDEKLYLQLDKPYYSGGEKIWFKGYLRNAITHAALPHSNFIYVELVAQDDELVSRVKVKRDSTGFDGYLALDPQLEPGNYTLRGYTRWMLNQDEDFIFNKLVSIVSPIPEKADSTAVDLKEKSGRASNKKSKEEETPQNPALDYKVQFFPEGGDLIGSTPQMVAFKALAEDGHSLEISGEVFNPQGEVVAQIESTHNGMGMFMMYTQVGEQYYAITRSIEGLEHRFDLPVVSEVGAAMTLRESKGQLLFQSVTSPLSLLNGAYYVIHSRGRIIAVNSASAEACHFSFNELYDGINTISLISKDGAMLAQRLVFKYPEVYSSINFESDKANYKSREKVKIKLNLKTSNGDVPTGEFGVSVTDDSSVHAQQGGENIVSYLLLSSDIRGYIESPGSYFEGDMSVAERNMDLLMRTQGWQRFDIEKILAGDNTSREMSYETSAEISGNVKGFFGNQARQPRLDVICTSLNYVDSFILDESSRFKLVGLDIPDSTTYVIQSRGRKGGNTLSLSIDPELFATPRSTIAPRQTKSYIPTSFINQSQEKFYYEGGMDLISLDAVYVTANLNTKNETSYSSHSQGAEELESMGGAPLMTALQRFPSVTLTEEGVVYRGSSTFARFLVDDIYMDYEEVNFLSTADVESIEFVSGIDAVMYMDAAGGIFIIKLKSGASTNSSVTSPGIAFVQNLGYQKPIDFYVPSYDSPRTKQNPVPDLRTTIYWNGKLTPDENGQIEFEFYAADKATSYTMTVEGVDDNGELYRAESELNRTAL